LIKKILITSITTLALFAVILVGCSKSAPQPPSSSPLNPQVTTPVSPQVIPMVPAQYQSLYNQLQRYISDNDKQINTEWDGSSYPVNYAAELLTADANAGPGILQTSVQQVMIEELDGERFLGVQAITVQIGFPILDQNFYMVSGQSAAQAQRSVQTWMNYYQLVTQAIHSRGLKMIVESNPLLSYYISQQSSFNPGNYYKSLDFATYEERRSEHNLIIAQQIKPDYLLLQTEPQTDAIEDFRPELNIPEQDVAMISKFVTDLEKTGISGLHASIQIGSGAGTWEPNWQSYISGLAAISGLDRLDTHIYNLHPNINQIGEIPITIQIADMAHAVGKGVSISEFWLHKSTALVGLTTGGDSLPDIRARDVFSFWAPLDEQFLQMMAKLANHTHCDYISAFGHYNWFTLTDYNSLRSPCPPIYPATNSTQNSACDSQIINTQNQLAKQALAKQQLSPTGNAYKAVIANVSAH
jgi:hypothetical protein